MNCSWVRIWGEERNGLSLSIVLVYRRRGKAVVGGEYVGVVADGNNQHIMKCTEFNLEARGGVVVKALRYKSKGRWFDS